MTLLGLFLAVILLAIATLHAYWGLGGVWPGTDAKSCARAVVGLPGVTAMPTPAAAFSVAAALLAATIVALAAGNVIAQPFGPLMLGLATLGAAVVFVGRGLAGFTPAWRRLTPEQPFATFDVRYYSPLCLVVGAGFVVLLLWRTSS